MSEEEADALARLIGYPRAVRKRVGIYFNSIEPNVAQHWLSGLQVGASVAGLHPPAGRYREACLARRLDPDMGDLVGQLESRGYGPEAIVDELMAIEIETWQQAGGNSV